MILQDMSKYIWRYILAQCFLLPDKKEQCYKIFYILLRYIKTASMVDDSNVTSLAWVLYAGDALVVFKAWGKGI